jgi:hypothetical protein
MRKHSLRFGIDVRKVLRRPDVLTALGRRWRFSFSARRCQGFRSSYAIKTSPGFGIRRMTGTWRRTRRGRYRYLLHYYRFCDSMSPGVTGKTVAIWLRLEIICSPLQTYHPGPHTTDVARLLPTSYPAHPDSPDPCQLPVPDPVVGSVVGRIDLPRSTLCRRCPYGTHRQPSSRTNLPEY